MELAGGHFLLKATIMLISRHKKYRVCVSYLEEDGDSQIHEGLCEVDDTLSGIVD